MPRAYAKYWHWKIGLRNFKTLKTCQSKSRLNMLMTYKFRLVCSFGRKTAASGFLKHSQNCLSTLPSWLTHTWISSHRDSLLAEPESIIISIWAHLQPVEFAPWQKQLPPSQNWLLPLWIAAWTYLSRMVGQNSSRCFNSLMTTCATISCIIVTIMSCIRVLSKARLW